MINKKALSLTILLFILTFVFGANNLVSAEEGNLDSYDASTENWRVEINKSEKKSDIPNSHIYNLKITKKNPGEENIRFEIYRALDDSSEFATVYSGPMVSELEEGKSTGFYNFPLNNDTTKLHITIYWKEEGRDFKEMFQVTK